MDVLDNEVLWYNILPRWVVVYWNWRRSSCTVVARAWRWVSFRNRSCDYIGNQSCSDFAVLDRLMSQSNTHRVWSQNKTSKWFKQKSSKNKLLENCRRFEKEEIKALLQKNNELSKKKEKDLKEKEQLTLKILHLLTFSNNWPSLRPRNLKSKLWKVKVLSLISFSSPTSTESMWASTSQRSI